MSAVGRHVHPPEEAADPAGIRVGESNALHGGTGRPSRRDDESFPMVAGVGCLGDSVDAVLRLQRRIDDLRRNWKQFPGEAAAAVVLEDGVPMLAAVGRLEDGRRAR